MATLEKRAYLREWRDASSMSAQELAARAGLSVAQIEALESGAADYSGAELGALAGVLGCDAWRLICSPPDASPSSDQFRNRLVAQMLRDICVEAVITFDDMGRLDDLKKNIDAEEFWSGVATLFINAVETISRTEASLSPFALSGR